MKKKIFKSLLALTLATAISFSVMPEGQAYASDYLTQENFDYDWYLEKHPDLAAFYSKDDHEGIWNFYVNTGKPAGWIGRKAKSSYVNFTTFDYDAFLANNPDVLAAIGTDHKAVYDWYVTLGAPSGRKAISTLEENNVIMDMYDIANSITNKNMSDREKVKAVHDWLIINVAYDIDNYNRNTIPHSSYTVVGPIKYHRSVCSGYARAFQKFMDILGIECEIINGYGNGGGHAWNKVKVNGTWYWIDVTWDDPVPDRPNTVYRYDYFLISESQMNIDHTPDKY